MYGVSTPLPRHFARAMRRLISVIVVAAIGGGSPSLPAASVADRLVQQALSSPSAARGATMFATVPPDRTGVVTENRYADPRMWGERNRIFDIGAIGSGIAIGDYDSDGRPDIYVVSKTESCRLFRNLGGWKFEDVTTRAGVADSGEAAHEWKQGATFADINNDGRLDIYVCRFAAPNLLYVNQGDGTFREEAQHRGLAIIDASGMAAFCDYDRDGWLDLYLQTNLLDAAGRPNGQRDYLFHNNGRSAGSQWRFTNVTEHAGIRGDTQGHAVVWWDYDNDSWPDIYVANDFGPPDSLYRNNRNGTFSDVIDAVVPHMPYSSMGADLADVNNDGLIDLLATEMAASTREKDLRGMAESRERGQLENPNPGTAQLFMRNALYLNTDTGFCQEAALLAGLGATDWTWSVRFEDLDNDGWTDLHVTNGMYREMNNADLLNRMMATENLGERVRLVRASPVLAERNLAFRNLGDLRFEEAGAAWGLDQLGVSFAAALGDLDGDGDLDLAFTNYEAGVTLLRNDSDSGHRVIVALRGTASNRFGVDATVRLESDSGIQVRQLVLARGYMSSSEPILHFGLGLDATIKRLTVTWPSGRSETFTDLPTDRRFTITEPADPTPPPSPPPRIGSGSGEPRRGMFSESTEAAGLALTARETEVDEIALQPLLPMRHSRSGPALAVGDLFGDGGESVLMGGTPRDPLRVLRRGASEPYPVLDTIPLPDNVPIHDGPLLVFDADGNGTMDVLRTKAGASLPQGVPLYQPSLLLNRGSGVLQPAQAGSLPALPVCAGAVAAADFDRDGRLDVFFGGRVRPGQYPLSPQSGLLNNRGAGRFEDVTDRAAPALREVGMVTSALWSDVDDDGWPDLLVALEWGGVKFFRNREGRGFEDRSTEAGFAAAGTGWWTSLAAADFNGDGRPDYVAGNAGLNTLYRASPEKPALLFYGDFGGDAGPRLIEASHEGDRLVPWRSRKQLIAAVPTLRRRYPQNESYSRASLQEMLGEDALAAAARFAATELASGVFLSQPDGTFRFSPLPRIAQIAPFQGLIAGDVDGDGRADIYAVQNSYAPVPVIGHFDGGVSQLLLGDGRGNFRPASPAESGLIVRGDAKALVVVDLGGDGWPDFLVSRNNSTSLAFRNGGTPGCNSMRVLLRGPTGNPTAIGARVTVELADGTTQTSEVHAGSGYYSQSSAACFFGWPDSSPARQVRVRWPSGTTTVHDAPKQSGTATLSMPPK